MDPRKRAVAVKVDKVIGVAGFVHPGNRVDVLVTMAKGKDAEPFTKIVREIYWSLPRGRSTRPPKERNNNRQRLM